MHRILAGSAKSRDTTHFVMIIGRDGWVHDYDHVWAVPPARGRVLLDSLLTALTRAHGPPTYCPRPDNAPPGTSFLHAYWPPAPYARELSMFGPPADTVSPPVPWRLVLRTTHQPSTCPRGS